MITELLMPKAFRTTLPALRSAASNWGPLSVIHFDSHLGNTAESGVLVMLIIYRSRYMGSGRFRWSVI